MALKDEEITTLYRARRTLLEMLNDRGYAVIEPELNITKEDFIQKFGPNMTREDLDIHKSNRHNDADQIYVFFPKSGEIGLKNLKTYLSRMNEDKVSRAIVVVRTKLSHPASKFLLSEGAHRIEIFQEEELQINITKSVLVPKHQLLTREETKAVLEKYTADATQLPKIQMTDPVARYYGMKRGEVVKITRSSETAGNYITYRYVI